MVHDKPHTTAPYHLLGGIFSVGLYLRKNVSEFREMLNQLPIDTVWSNLWYIHTASWDQDQWILILCRNVYTGLRQGRGPGPIISYCANPVPCTGHWSLSRS